MTDFIFKTPKCFTNAEKIIDKMNNIGDCLWDRPEYTEAALLLMRKNDAKDEARWRWLAENQKELWYFEVMTKDIGYAFADVVTIFDKKGSIVWEFICDCWNAKKYLKRKMKRFGIPTDLISYGF